MANRAGSKHKNVCFEEALGKLEVIVKQLETGELPLEEALDKFGEGISHAKYCFEQLNTAEAQVDKILQQEQGQLVEKPLNLAEGNQ
ncbi:exodeoxyribonuclease VII small subunit [Sporomusa acidovorans]|uniref:Exodeoxyribonuclease 7 small subunit n=1 Tax=Sporomusa acidovorans (strain ATCC 49682 / DSM 3132 / Mol) TaxID=1123286 RepID=A0ABZ3J462_SPOA4|nr:exodeoxyribonuclease VII small subunit [Sporomusa acidovorans]OZC20363.1 exodeoxyribonuclease 7 small subunit [Sporomusa acidovorans DSM 3132]SDD36532.1 Exodeoxyribonuclease VII small subunit [Sporomusa acidovorans]